MERSNFANVLIATRLLPHFTAENIVTMKSCIFAQFGCETETQFLCKVLKNMCSSLSNESTAIIKNKAIELADSQPITACAISPQNDSPTLNLPANTSKETTLTIYNYIEQQYNDPLSKLNSDGIDHIGSFLTKEESIEFGYLNKQLYIETQKISFLLKRCKDYSFDKSFHVENTSATKLLIPPSGGYSYSFVTCLSLNIDCFRSVYANNSKILVKKEYFSNFFRRLNYLRCWSGCFNIVPFDLLFNKNSNFYDSDESQEYLGKLDVWGMFEKTDDHEKLVGECYTKLAKLQKGKCSQMRKIRHLVFNVTTDGNKVWKQLFLLLCSQSESLSIVSSMERLGIDNVNELKTMFHDNMKRLCMSSGTGVLEFDYESKMSNNDNNDSNDSNDNKERSYKKIGMLEEIEMTLPQFWNSSENVDIAEDKLMRTLDFFDKFKIRRNIKQYVVNVRRRAGAGYNSRFIKKLCFQDCHNHPLLEKIIFKVTDGDGLRLALGPLISYKKELFVDKSVKLGLKYLKTIDLVVDGAHDYFRKNRDHGANKKSHEKLYSIDRWVIEIDDDNVAQYIDSMEGDICNWLSKISAANGNLRGRTVVLHI